MHREGPHEQLDLRELGSDPLLGLARRLDALPPGTPCEVLAGESLDPVRQALGSRMSGALEWWTLEDGPYLFRAMVARRRASDGPATLVGMFKADHGRMRRIQVEARKGLETGDRQLAAHALAELRVGLARHAAGEEAVMFPAFQATGAPGAAQTVATLVGEHQRIREALARVVECLGCEERFDQPEAVRRFDALTSLLQAHEDREERLVMPKVEV